MSADYELESRTALNLTCMYFSNRQETGDLDSTGELLLKRIRAVLDMPYDTHRASGGGIATDPKPKTCTWAYDATHGYFRGACGIDWTVIDGTLAENSTFYCPKCGGKIVEEDEVTRS